jgi:hypothetical protein
MSTAYQKGIRKLRKQAMEQGWREAEKKSGWMLYSPDGTTQVMIHKTASDSHALGNIVSVMRDGGFKSGGKR